ncbi:zinc ribbon domain-containing protein [Patescibacteria group bacterium]|nr:zinc ribbon domain-containing protein [Patescibacteria group bacterium]
MPKYDFNCPKCKHVFEKTVKMGQQTSKCPKCDFKSAKKSFSALGGIIFKGSGFYKTDSRGPEKTTKSEKCPASKKCGKVMKG